jgi:serine/threonine-protein kinase
MARIREGTVIADKYRIERPLARGGMGTIWIARHLPLDMPVAVKFMDAAFAATSEGRTRFEREARAVALIQSPNIIHVHDYGIHEDLPYMAMELLQGEDLGARIRKEGKLSLPFLAGVIAQVCRALRKAHDAGIIHRDLKPANVYLARDDDEQIVKVLDFGVAKMIGVGDAGDATKTGVVVGSVHYMSPEQARGMKDIDRRADLWSLGVIACRALTGHLPFPGDQMGDVIVKICTDPFPPLAKARPDLGPDVEAFFDRALAKKPDERFQSARELAAAFGALAGAAGEVTTGSRALAPASARGADLLIATPPSQRKSAPDGAGSAPNAPAPTSAATPFAMSPQSEPPHTPPVAPIFPPPMSSTLTSASGVSDAGPAPPPARRGGRSIAVGAAVLGVALIAGVLAFRGGHEAGHQASGGPAESTAATAVAPAPPPTAATPTVTADTAAPPATATAAASGSAAAAAAKTAAPKGAPGKGAPPAGKKINSELGFQLLAEDLHPLQHDVLVRAVARGGHAGDLVDDVLPAHDLAEDRVLVVEVRRGALGDEPLGAVGARARVGHREHARPVVAERGVELVLEAVAGVARAPARGHVRVARERVAALDHEVGDDAVEAHAVVEGRALHRGAGLRILPVDRAHGEADEVLHRLRHELLLEPHHEVAERGREPRVELALAGNVDLRKVHDPVSSR